VVTEGVETIRPKLPELLKPGIKGSQFAGFQAIKPLLAFRAHADQAGLTQLFEVLGRPRLTKARSLHKITRRPFPISQEFEQATAVRLSYGFKRAHAKYIRSQLYNCQGIYRHTVRPKRGGFVVMARRPRTLLFAGAVALRSPMQLRPPGRTASFAARTCAFAGVVDKPKGLRAQIE
jgi:hypothetical protein